MPLTPKAIIVVAALVGLPLQAVHAAAGRFLSVVGDVRVVAADGGRRAVDRGSEVESGDTVVTGDGAFAQLTMTDGARLQVREDTELKLDDYAYEEQGAGRSFMSLLRGTMRSITGLIGKRRKEDYRVRTPHATIGIRGTDHQVTVLLKPREGFEAGTFDVVFTGGTVMQTDAGRIDIAPRQAGYVTSQSSSPRVIEVPAFLKPAAAQARAGTAARKARVRKNKATAGQDESGKDSTQRGINPAATSRLGSAAETPSATTKSTTPTLRTPLGSPLLTPLSGATSKTPSTVPTAPTLDRSTTPLIAPRFESTAPNATAPTRQLSPKTSPTLTAPITRLPLTTVAPSTTTVAPSKTTAPSTIISPRLTTPLRTNPTTTR